MRGDLFVVLFGQSTTADRVHRPGIGDYAVAVFDLKLHPIGVKGEEDVGLHIICVRCSPNTSLIAHVG